MEPNSNDPKKNPREEDKKPKNIWLALMITIVIVLGIIGFLTSISTARSCLQSMRKEIDRISEKRS